MSKKILVTESFLPSFSVYSSYIKKLWKTKWLTNNGEYAQLLEKKLKEYLGVKHLFFVSNGTIALQIAIRALNLRGEIITTPYSFAATLNSIIWEQCKPVFCDIEKDGVSIDIQRLEKLITKQTKAILAVHVYGYPCNVDAIKKIAKKHNIKVIYDAAHAFGVHVHGVPIMNFGDISTVSFHATKLFHTIEGGAIITNDDAVARKISQLRSFGLDNDLFVSPGINGKNSEFHAAMGLAVFDEIPNILEKRKKIVTLYDNLLSMQYITRPNIPQDTVYNYAYYPVFFNSEKTLLHVKSMLEEHDIYPRRYFYPSLNTVSYLEHYQSCPISESLSKRVLCLPLAYNLTSTQVKYICNLIKRALLPETIHQHKSNLLVKKIEKYLSSPNQL